MITNFLNKYRLARYVMSGLSSFFIDYFSFLLFYYILHVPLLISNSLSFVFAFVIGFVINRNWTFQNYDGYRFRTHYQITMYLVLAIINFFISNSLIYLLNKKLLLPAAIAKLLIIGIVALWNYTVFRLLIFKKV